MSFGKRAAPPAGDNNSQAPPGSGSTRSDAGGGGDLGVSMERLAPMGLALQKILTSAYTEPNGRAHIETLLAAAAALAGEFALRAAAPPGTLDQDVGWFLGGAPDGLLYADEAKRQMTVWAMVKQIAAPARNRKGELPSIEAIVRKNDAQVGKAPYPPLSVPPDHFPHEYSPNAPVRFRAEIFRLAEMHGLNPRQAVLAIAATIAFILRQADDAGFDAAIGATLVGEVMVGVSRMKPLTKAL
jgi:hypothetical protein